MFEAIRAIIRKIFQDKLIFALVLVSIMAVFFSGVKLQDGGSNSTTETTTTTTTAALKPGALQPSLAVDFIKWWLAKAFDCNPQTANQSHQEAGGWMTPAAINTYNSVFWSSPLAKGVMTGQIQAQFVPQTIIAVAANPDGSVVVGVRADVQYTNGGPPVTEKLRTDFLVMHSADGLRIAGIYNHAPTATMTTFVPAVQ
jgi:hypothetical protein